MVQEEYPGKVNYNNIEIKINEEISIEIQKMNKLEENFIFFGQVIMEIFNKLSLLYNQRAIGFQKLVEFIFGVQVREDKTCSGNGYGMLAGNFFCKRKSFNILLSIS